MENSHQQRLSSLAGRREEVERELGDLADSRGQSTNAALGELEAVLLKELEKIDGEIKKLQGYLKIVDANQEPQS